MAAEKHALVTGVTGQDGSYLAQLLLEKSYRVFGAVRPSSRSNFARLQELGIARDVEFVDMDLLEYSNILRVFEQIHPDEVYNLAAQQPQSPVPSPLRQRRLGRHRLPLARHEPVPIDTGNCDALGVARLLEAARTVNPKFRFFQASSSEAQA